MSIEQNVETTIQFIQIWRENPERIQPELVSLNKETTGKPDTYHFLIEGGILIDPETGQPVEKFIDTTTPLGRIEADIAKKLGRWGEENEEGLAFWISPPYPGRYPRSKLILHRIAYTWEGAKVLDNSAILFDAPEKEILALVPTGINNLENLRKVLFVGEDKEEIILEMEAKLKKYFVEPTQDLDEEELASRAEYYQELILRGVDPETIARQMQKTGFLGENSISCPPTFSEFISGKLTSETAKFVRRCGNCGVTINAVISKGYRCPSCGGTYEGC